MAAIPRRVTWAVRELDVQPADQILEVGCGDGHALSLIAQTPGVRVVGVDRSALAIRAATKRNGDGLRSGRVQLVESELAELRLADRFTKVFALNVNVFWHRPKKELAVIRDLLVPGGVLLVLFEPPSADQIDEIAGLCRRNLEAGGFSVEEVSRAKLPASVGLLIRATIGS
ncbi:MAG TPA: class I SAM-dependent methyltransferase [Longimicrobiales bacterium]|nr:class I SAM-dependent methyltransferase [Longimicrobiales bacterium]